MTRGPYPSFKRDAGGGRAFVPAAPRVRSLTALLIGSTALTAVALAPAAHAGTPSWVGNLSTDWYTAGNWSPAGVPTLADNVSVDAISPHITVISGGTAASQLLFVGAIGSGNLAIMNGGSLTNNGLGYLGFFANGAGTVSVDGTGSIWANTAGLEIGSLGTGTLTVTHGGTVSDLNASIGSGAGSSGIVTVTGAGSTWTNSGDVSVGDHGTGALTISNGALAITAGNSIVGNLGTGAATVSGGGTVWSAGVNLAVGLHASGTLQVLQGGSVSTTSTDIGAGTGTHGAVTIDGTGSALGAGALTVGEAGIGQLTISGGGSVNSTGTILGYYGGSSGSALVSGTGSTWATDGLTVAEAGSGALAISNGGAVTSTGAIKIGADAGVTGSVTVDGAGSSLGLNSNAVLSVGEAGIGTLTITNGGSVANVDARVGNLAGATGSVLVDGAGSSWSTANVLFLGVAGTGTLTVSNGGHITSIGAAIGAVAGGSGSAVIDGAGSSWTSTSLSVGYATTGALAVTHGGSVTNILTIVGENSGSSGSITVDGAGSFLTNASSIKVGDAGTGSLTIANGGAVAANGQFLIANQAGSTGALNIGAAPGSVAAAPGTLTTATVQFGAGTGAINFNHTSANYTFAADISGTGAVNQLSGNTVLTGNNSYDGPTNISGGRLSVNSTIAASNLTTVSAGGTLGGIGIVGNTLVGGTLAPGNPNSVGTLTVAGNLVLTSAATYMVQVSGTSASNTVVTGFAALGGTLAVQLTGRVAATTTYTILTSSNTTGTFGSVSMSNLAYARNARVSYSGNDVLLTLDPGMLSPSLPGFANINQRNVAAGIDNALLGGGSMTTGFNALFNATGQNLLNGLTQASGEVATGAQQGTFNAMGQFLNTLLDPFFGGRNDTAAPAGGASHYADDGAAAPARGNAARDAYAAIYQKAPGAAGSFAQRWSVWAAGYGGSQTTDGNAVVGSNTATSRIAGVAAGADYQISPNTLVGFALGGGGTSFGVANGLGSGSSNLFQAGMYARHTMGNAYVAGALAYGWQDVTTDRTVTIAGVDHLRARFDANALSGRIEGGYRYVTPWMGITPYAAAQFTTFYLPGYGEQAVSGANTFALNYGAKDVTAPRSELGLRTDRSYALETAVLTLRSRAAWAHDFNPNRAISATFQTLPGASFVVNGAAPASDAALLTGAAELKWLNGFSLSGTFEGEFSSVTRSYAGKGIARYRW